MRIGCPIHGESFTSECRPCQLFRHSWRYRRAWGGNPNETTPGPIEKPVSAVAVQPSTPCIHEGPILEYCSSCTGARAELRHVRECDIHDRCTRGGNSAGIQSCLLCPDKRIEEQPVETKWAYGVTTVPIRWNTLLPQTLASLKAAGFDAPRLFLDGAPNSTPWLNQFGLEVTTRFPAVRTAFNWILSLAELWLRNPMADRFALFQDDLVICRNVRAYLDRCPFPAKGYWNLYAMPSNEHLRPGDGVGFYPSNQLGHGAVALVFNREGVMELLSSRPHIWDRPLAANGIGWRKIDGGIVDAMKKKGFVECVHGPSLIQHTGLQSTTRDANDVPTYWKSASFPGEAFDALEFLRMNTSDAAWRAELEALERAIADDRQRLAAATDRLEQRRLRAVIAKYEDKLAAHRSLARAVPVS